MKIFVKMEKWYRPEGSKSHMEHLGHQWFEKGVSPGEAAPLSPGQRWCLSEEVVTADSAPDGGEFVPVRSTAEKLAYLDSLSLVGALWWFIENVDWEAEDRSELYFHLRERMRTEAA